MRTLHVGLRVADLVRSIAFYISIGYEVLGDVPATQLGTLTMLKLPGDEFVALELVHDPTTAGSSPGASATSLFRSRTCTRRWRAWLREGSKRTARITQRLRRLLDGMGH